MIPKSQANTEEKVRRPRLPPYKRERQPHWQDLPDDDNDDVELIEDENAPV